MDAPRAQPDPNSCLGAEIRLTGAVWQVDAESTLQAARVVDRERGADCARELLRILHLFLGFPRVVAALNALDQHGDAEHCPDSNQPTQSNSQLTRIEFDSKFSAATRRERHAAGAANFARFYGEQAERVLTHLEHLDPLFRDYIVEHAYGRVLAHTQIPIVHKERLALLCLAACRCWKQWESHARIAIREGAYTATMRADLTLAASWIDTQAAQQAAQSLDRFAQGECA